MKQTSVLVTGASSGFGKCIALTFARAGYHVYATGRNLTSEKLLDIKNTIREEQLSIEWLEIDVTKQTDIERAYEIIKDKGLDILINNAGFGILGPIEGYSIEDFQKQFDTNFYGVLRMTYTFLPLLKQSGEGRIITISSIAGLIVAPAYGLYASSKHAVEVFMEALRYELFDTHVKVALIEPGGFDTQFTANSKGLRIEKHREQGIPRWWKKMISTRNKYVGEENNIIHYKRNPQRVADYALKIARKKNPPLHHIIGQGALSGYILRRVLPTRVWEWGMRMMLKHFNKGL